MELMDYNNKFFECIINGEFFTIGNYVSQPHTNYLCFAEDETYLERVCQKENVSCVICKKEFLDSDIIKKSDVGVAVSDNPRWSMYQFHNWLVANNENYTNKYNATEIGLNCKIDESVRLPEYGVIIGNNVEIQENVIIRPGTTIGDDTTIFTGAVLGGENYIVSRDNASNQFLVKQIGGLKIGKGCSIGHHSFIAKGSFSYDYTVIGDYTLIDSNVEISHNSVIGKNCIILAQSQVCGNCEIGDNVRISPQSIISNRNKISNEAVIGVGSVVVNNVRQGQHVSGNYAIDHDKFLMWHRRKIRAKD